MSLEKAIFASDELRSALTTFAAVERDASAPAAAQSGRDAPEGEQKLSKNAAKKLAKGGSKEKKEKPKCATIHCCA